ncbi:HNH endonuclease signature motif containing protein [Rhizobium sp. B21/90]|uniref:HNH endonuclease n=1 Tax=Rhizobium sp. B21/90 TaxID=2819993 RepID=UPI001C5B9852|nr:HNH endonuclease signature motif containing protein [Rhizobium sp. B21/90]QYA05049.1 HNH endonuclease [Rhizobium sp. B21/90]
MTWGFERGRKYSRKLDIHGHFGGQEQGGIITPASHSLVIATTGSKGRNHGYEDLELPDGSFEYFGAGRRGDMVMSRGNEAILNHSANSKSLLLFRNEGDGYSFLGEFVCSGYEIRQAPDEDSNIRNAFVFRFWPLDNIDDFVSEQVDLPTGLAAADLNLEELRRRAYDAARPSVPSRPQTSTVYERSRDVALYVFRRANGLCEYDGKAAPFLRENGEPYLEPHHIQRVSDGGPDDPRSVVALCPNCHRRAHSGVGKAEMKAQLMEKVRMLEQL